MLQLWYDCGDFDDFIYIDGDEEKSFEMDLKSAIENGDNQLFWEVNGVMTHIVRVDDDDAIVYMSTWT